MMQIRIYLDLLQYSQEEQRQIAAHNKGKGGSGANTLRNVDAEPQWHANFQIKRNNQVYETTMKYDEVAATAALYQQQQQASSGQGGPQTMQT